MSTPALPVAPTERIAILDAIRGVALLGIFIMNLPAFAESLFGGFTGADTWPMWWDRAANFGREVLFAGKFNSMFSMLFAVGFTIQFGRLLERDPAAAYWTYSRRLLWLFAFGLIHGCLFWTGDILHMYAVLGLLLVLVFRRLPDRVIAVLIVLMLLSPTIVVYVRYLSVTPQELARVADLFNAWHAMDNAVLGHGTFLQVILHNVRTLVLFYTEPYNLLSTINNYMLLGATMLIGLLLGRHRFFQNSAAYLPLVRRVQWWALGIGIAAGVVFGVWFATVENPGVPTVWKIFARTCFSLSRVAVMFFYVALIVRAMHDVMWRRRLQPLVTVGRMPLTNYLLQTLIATFLFYGWGLGLWGKVGPALQVALACAVFFLLQVPLSRLWLQRYEAGPIEHLWRVLTYGRASVPRLQPRRAGAVDG